MVSKVFIYHNKTSFNAYKRCKSFVAQPSSAILLPASFRAFLATHLRKLLPSYAPQSPKDLEVYLAQLRQPHGLLPRFCGEITILIEILIACLELTVGLSMLAALRPRSIFLSSDRTSYFESFIAKYLSRNVSLSILPYAAPANAKSMLKLRGIINDSPSRLSLGDKHLLVYGKSGAAARAVLGLMVPNPFLIASFDNIRLFKRPNFPAPISASRHVSSDTADLDFLFYSLTDHHNDSYDLVVNAPHYYEHSLASLEADSQILSSMVEAAASIDNIRTAIVTHPKSRHVKKLEISGIPVSLSSFFELLSPSAVYLTCPSSTVGTALRIGCRVVLFDPLGVYFSSEFSGYRNTDSLYYCGHDPRRLDRSALEDLLHLAFFAKSIRSTSDVLGEGEMALMKLLCDN
jgi:hypothetical protein